MVDSTFRSLKTARDLLQEAIKETEKPIHLAPLAYSFTSLAGTPDSAEIASTQAALKESSRLRSIGVAILKEVAKCLADSLEKTEKSLARSVKQSDDAYGEVLQTRGQTYRALNTALRSTHVLNIRRDVDAGPQEGRFEKTSQKYDRPLVRHRPSEVLQTTIQETSQTGYQVFTRSLSAASADVFTLATQHRRLSAAAHDAHLDMSVDQQVIRHRRRCDPARRV